MQERTESFCERCGTRFVFVTDDPGGGSIRRAGNLARGLRNFVMTDSGSVTDALASAERDDRTGEATRVTAAFRRTFNFCLTCRQYACDRCWNPSQGACLTCAPDATVQPVAPPDHLIARTPATRPQSEGSLFPDVLDAAGQPLTTQAAPSGEWPARDLQARREPAAAPDAAKSSAPPATVQAATPAARPQGAGPTPDPGEMEEILAQLSRLDSGPPPAPSPKTTASATATGPAAAPAATAGTVRRDPAPDRMESPKASPTLPGVARLLGRLVSGTDGEQATGGRRRRAGPVGDPWPRPTPWAERPVKGIDFRLVLSPVPATDPAMALSTGTAIASIAAEVAVTPSDTPPRPAAAPLAAAPLPPALLLPPVAPPPLAAPLPRVAPLPPVEELPSAAQAARARLAALTSSRPVASTPSAIEAEPRVLEPDPAAPAMPTVFDPHVEPPEPTRALEPALSPEPGPALETSPLPTPAPWKPLGSRWPIREKPSAVEAPEIAPSPAVIAARRSGEDEASRVWVQSAEEVLNRGSVRVCHHCALPVSTQARFCRRCGTRQA